MRASLPSRDPNLGFTLVELLVAIVIAAVLMAGFTQFYVSEQRAIRHHQIEIETSQALRTALEEMSRDLRSARKNLLGLTGSSAPTLINADDNLVEFSLDSDDNGFVDLADPAEHMGFRLPGGGTTIQTCDPDEAGICLWSDLAQFIQVSGLSFSYYGYTCDLTKTPPQATALTQITTVPVTAPNTIKAIDISITASRPVIGGLAVSRAESESVRLRNLGACS